VGKELQSSDFLKEEGRDSFGGVGGDPFESEFLLGSFDGEAFEDLSEAPLTYLALGPIGL